MKVYVLLQHFDHEQDIAGVFTTVNSIVDYFNYRVDTDVSVIGFRTKIDDYETVYELYHRAVAGISTEHVATYSAEEYEVQG